MEQPETEMREAFERWRVGSFSDEEASDICGLAPRALRDLAKWGAIETVAGARGRGKRRQWERPALCKATITAALQRAGFSLPLAARIAFHFWNIDPSASFDPFLRFPTWKRLQTPRDVEQDHDGGHPVSRWLGDQYINPRHDLDFDSYLHIVNGRYVTAVSALPPLYQRMHKEAQQAMGEALCAHLGRISDEGARFRTWQRPRLKHLLNDEALAKWKEAHAAGMELSAFLRGLPSRWDLAEQYGDEIDLEFLDYQQEPADSDAAQAAFENFTTRTTVNVTLPMRIAMRKAMGLPVAGER